MSDVKKLKELDIQAHAELQRVWSAISQYNSTVERLNKLRKELEPMSPLANGISDITWRGY